MHKILLKIACFIGIIMGSGIIPSFAQGAKESGDSVIVFRFMARNETFWATYRGNDKEFGRLAQFIQGNRQLIMTKRMPIFVNGYCASFESEDANRKMSRKRSNHVKSYVITHHGLTEDHFKTKNYTIPLEGQTDIVTLTFTVRAADIGKLAKPTATAINVDPNVAKAASMDALELYSTDDKVTVENYDFNKPKRSMVMPPNAIPAQKEMTASQKTWKELEMVPDNNIKPKSIKSGLAAPVFVEQEGNKSVKVKKSPAKEVKPAKQEKTKTEKATEPKPEKVKKEKPAKVKSEKAPKPVKTPKVKPVKEPKIKAEKKAKVKAEKPIKATKVEPKTTNVVPVPVPVVTDKPIVNQPLEYEITSDEITKKLKEKSKDTAPVKTEKVKKEKTTTVKAEKAPKPVKTPKVKEAKPTVIVTKKPKEKPVETAAQPKVIKTKKATSGKDNIAKMAVKPNSNFEFELKTNLLYWLGTVANLEGEVLYKQKLSLNLDYQFAHTDINRGDKRLRISAFSPEVRYYFIPGRLFLGAYYNTGEFNFKFSQYGYQGAYNGGGLSIGYKLPISKSLGFEFSVAGGYAWADFDKYTFDDGCNRFNMSDGKNYFGPTKAKVSLIWRIGGAKK